MGDGIKNRKAKRGGGKRRERGELCSLCGKPLPSAGRSKGESTPKAGSAQFRPNLSRHAKTFHFLCPKCLRLEHRAKHRHFGTQLLSRSTSFEVDDRGRPNEPCISQVFVPLQIRNDTLRALLAILSSREFMDNDVFTVYYFLLAKLRRSCLACQCLHHGDGSGSIFNGLHTCYTNAEVFLSENVEMGCLMFNVKCNEKAIGALREMILHVLRPNRPCGAAEESVASNQLF
jgi:hypothetical protein